MTKINNVEELRNLALDALEKLTRGEIDTAQALTHAKLCDSVILTIKTQLEYSRMVGESPSIPFMKSTHEMKLIDVKPQAVLGHLKSKGK